MKHAIYRDDILPMPSYARQRDERRRTIVKLKADRRVAVGPCAMFHFENYATIFHQVHEMLFVEQGGEAQIEGELEAYNPLIPNGQELIATLMFEIPDPQARARELAKMGGAEHAASLSLGAIEIKGQPIGDEERTRGDGKTSAVHFLRFPLSAAAVAAFKDPREIAALGISHPHYSHLARIPEPVRAALTLDLEEP